MSTNSTIVLRLHSKDKGKRKKANFAKVPHKAYDAMAEWEKKVGYIPTEERLKKNAKCLLIPEDANYIEIYHHWDGYPNSLGQELNNVFNTYEKALQLMLGGACSTILDGVMQYAAIRDIDSWDSIAPRFSADIPSVSQSYQYLFDEETNRWLYRESDKHKWKDISRFRG